MSACRRIAFAAACALLLSAFAGTAGVQAGMLKGDLRPLQWYLDDGAGALDQLAASGLPEDDGPIRVAVLDTGIDLRNPDFAGRTVTVKTIPDGAPADDRVGHGTFVAGIVSANPNDEDHQGISGLAPRAQLVVIKATDDANPAAGPSVAALVEGIRWAADHDVDVLNVSAVTPDPSAELHDALVYARERDLLVVASAGNTGTTTPMYPAADPLTLAVGATDESGGTAPTSARGAWVDLAAPGVDVVSTVPTTASSMFAQTTWATGSGTSFAAPLVTAAAARVWSSTPDANGDGLRADDVMRRLIATSDRVPGTGTDWKAGKLNLCRAVTQSATRCAPTAATRTSSAPTVHLPTSGQYTGLVRGGGELRIRLRAGMPRTVGRVSVALTLRCRAAGGTRTQRVTVTGTPRRPVAVPTAGGTVTARIALRGAGPLRTGTATLTARFTAAGRATGTVRARGAAAGLGTCVAAPAPWSATVSR